MSHTLIRTKSFGSLTAYCTCGNWSVETVGTDESSKRALNAGFKSHAEGGTK